MLCGVNESKDLSKGLQQPCQVEPGAFIEEIILINSIQYLDPDFHKVLASDLRFGPASSLIRTCFGFPYLSCNLWHGPPAYLDDN